MAYSTINHLYSEIGYGYDKDRFSDENVRATIQNFLISSCEFVWLTNCSRVIRNAWHFQYALVLVVKVVCGSIGIALLTP
ncbi:DUF3265 domain-containing protein [Vibrio parahaemolyticus]|nr:DUF3265 domain-containing protein [Vibrio parahaemolyticus]